MRRTAFVMMFAVMYNTAVSAQGYVRIDTLIRPYIQFDYQSWMDSGNPLCFWTTQMSFTYGGVETYLDGDCVQYNYIDGEVEIYGLEAWLWMTEYVSGVPVYPATDSPSPAEYLYLYDAKPDTFELKAQVPIMANDSTPFVWTGWWNSNDTSCLTGASWPEPLLRQYRYYFGTPVQLKDSFYVGGSNQLYRWGDLYIETGGQGEIPPQVQFQYGAMTTMKNYMNPNYLHVGDECQKPATKTKVRWTRTTLSWQPIGFPVNEWVPSESPHFWMVFPLIKVYDTIWTVDTPACLPVRDFSIMSRYGDTVMLRWSPLEGRSEFQVSYGPEGMDPDSGTLVNVTTNRWRFIDTLHTGEVMTAYVRTVCRELDTLRFSEWSEGVEWQTRVGIVQPDEDVRLTSRIHLQPNPAKERVKVVTPCGVKGIEVYGSYGIRWREFPAGTADFDVSDWAKGTYVVVIRTLAGSVTKKLVVE